jgi:hypothetical protein
MIARMDIGVHHGTHSKTFTLCGTVMNVVKSSEKFEVVTEMGAKVQKIKFSAGQNTFKTKCTVFMKVGEIAIVVGTLRKTSTSLGCGICIIFLDQSESGNWKKVGQGILTLGRDKLTLLCQVRRQHLQVGTKNRISVCECQDGRKRGPFRFPDGFSPEILPHHGSPQLKRPLTPPNRTDSRSKRPPKQPRLDSLTDQSLLQNKNRNRSGELYLNSQTSDRKGIDETEVLEKDLRTAAQDFNTRRVFQTSETMEGKTRAETGC